MRVYLVVAVDVSEPWADHLRRVFLNREDAKRYAEHWSWADAKDYIEVGDVGLVRWESVERREWDRWLSCERLAHRRPYPYYEFEVREWEVL